MFAALFIFTAVAFGVVIFTVIVVSVCIRLEDYQWTLSGPPRGPMRAFTRRMVGFYARDVEWHTRACDWPEPQPQSAEPRWPTSEPM